MNRKQVAVMVVMALAGLSLAACSDNDDGASGNDSESVTIGLLCSTTGPVAGYGVPGCAGSKAAVEEINANGGIDGMNIEVVEANDEGDPTKSPAAVEKLVSEGAVAIVASNGSGAFLQDKATFERLRVPGIAAISSADDIGAAPNNTFIYSMGTPNSQYGALYCSVFEPLGITKLGVITDTSPTMSAATDNLLSLMTDCISDPHIELIDPSAQDASSAVARIKEYNPDAVLSSTGTPDEEVLVQNALAAGLPDVPRFSTGALANFPDAWGRADPGALEGVGGPTAVLPGNKLNEEVAKILEARVDGDISPISYSAYDAVRLIADAIKAVGSDPVKINDWLTDLDGWEASFGYPGTTLSFTSDDRFAPEGLCALGMVEWGSDNQIQGAYPGVTAPECS